MAEVRDTYGPLPVPVPVVPSGAAPGDPLLDKLLAVFKASLNAYGRTAWQTPGYAPGQDLVNEVVALDPKEVTFEDQGIPVLYAWRRSYAMPFDFADDVRLREGIIALLWVYADTSPQSPTQRAAMGNAVQAILDAVTYRGRVPAWVDEGDDDPIADTYGSVLIQRLGLWSITVADVAPAEMIVRVPGGVGDSAHRNYPALAINLRVEERLVIGGYDPLLPVAVSVVSPEGGPPLTFATLNLPPAP